MSSTCELHGTRIASRYAWLVVKSDDTSRKAHPTIRQLSLVRQEQVAGASTVDVAG